MARLPVPGSNNNTWGDILNSFLGVEHNSDGSLKASGSLAAKLTIANNLSDVANAATARGNLNSAAKTVLVIDASGSGDYTTIAAAIAAAPTDGAQIFVKRGTHVISTMLTIPSNITLCGEGEGSIIQLANAGNQNLIYVSGNDVTIRDLRIDGNRANQTVTGNCIRMDGQRIKVLNCHVVGANGYNIVAWLGSSDIVVAHNISEDARDEGIEFMGCNHGIAIGNHVHTIGKNAILVWGNIAQGGSSSGIVIKGNTVSGASALNSGFAGIKVDDGANDVVITDNIVLAGGTSSPGIRIDSSTATTVNNVTVSNNSVINGVADAIMVQKASNITVSNNIIRGAATSGIKFSGATCLNAVASNNVVSSCLYGIFCDTVTSPQVTGNSVSSCTQNGINLNACTDFVCADNKLDSNGGSSTYNGLNAVGGTGGSITGNMVKSSGAFGISTQSSASIAVTGNTVTTSRAGGIHLRDCTDIVCTTNTCRNNGQGGNATWYNGIMVWRVSSTTANIVVTNNRCYDTQVTKTQGYGIRLLGAADNILVGNNIVDGNSVAGMGSDGAQTNLSVVPWNKLTATVGTVETSVAHGLSYAPFAVSVSMTSAGTIWRSSASDATNIKLTADASSRTADILVG